MVLLPHKPRDHQATQAEVFTPHLTCFGSLSFPRPDECCPLPAGVSRPHCHAPRSGRAFGSRGVPPASPILLPGRAAAPGDGGLMLNRHGSDTGMLPNPRYPRLLSPRSY